MPNKAEKVEDNPLRRPKRTQSRIAGDLKTDPVDAMIQRYRYIGASAAGVPMGERQ
jgi:hypothetical protein